jgi:acyl-coenzyme A thioesterase PaaI-like protein
MSEAREARRAAMLRLAESLRRLNDVAVCTDLPPREIEPIAAQLDAIAQALARAQHDGPFSGLLPRERDYARPHHAMPLSPVIGELNPMRPQIELRVADGRVRGHALLGKRFVGPAGFAHGGITAMICDQLVALAARAAGVRGVTRSLEVRYRRPTPLYESLELEGWCEAAEGDRARAVCEIRANRELCVRAEAELVVSRRITEATERRAAPPVAVDPEP